MRAHVGSTNGFLTQMNLLPDSNIGVFNSYMPGEDSMAHRLVNLYIMDLLLGEEPWLNLTTACSFPEPWVNPSSMAGLLDDEMYPDFSNPNYAKDYILGLDKQLKRNKFDRIRPKVDDYVGMYGNFAYGNITVSKSEANVLILQYGAEGFWELEYLGIDHMFYAHGQGKIWTYSFSIMFRKSVANVDVIDQAILLNDLFFPVFVRDRSMSDAYPPPDPTDCSG